MKELETAQAKRKSEETPELESNQPPTAKLVSFRQPQIESEPAAPPTAEPDEQQPDQQPEAPPKAA